MTDQTIIYEYNSNRNVTVLEQYQIFFLKKNTRQQQYYILVKIYHHNFIYFTIPNTSFNTIPAYYNLQLLVSNTILKIGTSIDQYSSNRSFF